MGDGFGVNAGDASRAACAFGTIGRIQPEVSQKSKSPHNLRYAGFQQCLVAGVGFEPTTFGL
jgi:hypothetical protein